MRKLAVLNRVVSVDELRIPPNNRLEALKGDRAGQFRIRVNDQWRICFMSAFGASVAEIANRSPFTRTLSLMYAWDEAKTQSFAWVFMRT